MCESRYSGATIVRFGGRKRCISLQRCDQCLIRNAPNVYFLTARLPFCGSGAESSGGAMCESRYNTAAILQFGGCKMRASLQRGCHVSARGVQNVLLATERLPVGGSGGALCASL